MITAFILLIAKPGKENSVEAKLKKSEQIKETHQIYGEYDMIAKIEVNSLNELDKFVTGLRKDKNIRATSTLITSD